MVAARSIAAGVRSMQSGNLFRTVNHRIKVYWESTSTSRDFTIFNKVGAWVGKNGRALDKKTPDLVVKEILSQYPDQLSEIDCEDMVTGKLCLYRSSSHELKS
jgi:hypothetical protein